MADGNAPFAESALAALLHFLDDGALVFEGEGHACREVSARAAEILGLGREALLGRSRDDVLAAIAPGDDATARAIAALRVAGEDEARREMLAIKGDPPRLVEWSTAPIERDGRVVGRIELLTDRTVEALLREELERVYVKMAETSIIDDVTGLSNRKHFENEIDREHRRSQRAYSSYAVARIDVDGMGRINDELGRDAGDRLLRRAGEVLKAARREYDLVARWENDELAVLLPGIDARSVKVVLARSLGAMRDAAHEVCDREVTFCAGVAVWIPPSIEAADEVVTRSITALRVAKVVGPGHVEIDARQVEWKDDPPVSGGG
jgi:diguanylate cyclase (GGDEF)-like protein